MSSGRPPIPDEVRHAAMRWNAPLSDAHAAVLLDALGLESAARVLDLGCGWGELLCRAVERGTALTGVGVDSDATALARGRTLVATRGLGERVSLIEAGGEGWTEAADRVICVGAGHIWDRTAAALQALAPLVAPGGRLLYGDGYLEAGASELTAELFDELGSLHDLLAAARGTGWRVLHLSVSDQLEWDEFESTHRAGPEQWLLSHPDVEGADEVRAWLDMRLREYVDGYRGELGFCWLVLAR
ncbi:MAG TPA: methyltransferase domain-containing protein [Solirubrobacteraceae bacterium]|nr:methyltransferase domain-containing protein [Solirubrobacteraceae bacterium]